MSARDEILDALLWERYGPSLWWSTAKVASEPTGDDELSTERRRQAVDNSPQSDGRTRRKRENKASPQGASTPTAGSDHPPAIPGRG